MTKKLRVGMATGVLLCGMVGIASASTVLTQTPQGGYAGNVLTGARWSTFTSTMTAQHSLVQTTNFENLSELLNYGAVWVDQELSGALTPVEISNLQKYYTSRKTEALVVMDSNWNDDTYSALLDNGIFAQNIVNWLADTSINKLVLIGENNSWSGWNQSIMSVVGGGFNGECSTQVGNTISAHTLTSGVSTVKNVCGSTISTGLNLGNPDILFDNNMAAVYTSNPVPVPAALWLFGSGLAGLAGLRRRRKSKV